MGAVQRGRRGADAAGAAPDIIELDTGQGGRGGVERAARRGADAVRGADAGDDAAGAGARVAAAQRQGVSRRLAVRDDVRRDVRVPRAREGGSDGDDAAVPGEPGLDEPRAHGLRAQRRRQLVAAALHAGDAREAGAARTAT